MGRARSADGLSAPDVLASKKGGDQLGDSTTRPADDAARARRVSYVITAVRRGPSESAVARWIASRARRSAGPSEAACDTIARSIRRNAIRSRTAIAALTREAGRPNLVTARPTST